MTVQSDRSELERIWSLSFWEKANIEFLFQENLRKHVLTTKRHPGKKIYQCQSCNVGEPYETNFTKELKAHLLEFHPAEYPSSHDAGNYIASIFRES